MTNAAIAIDTGDLPFGGGMLALVRPALDLLEPGGVLAVLTRQSHAIDELGTWCKVERHELLEATADQGGATRILLRKGSFGAPRGAIEDNLDLKPHGGRIEAADMLAAVPFAPSADPGTGFAPRGARVEPGGPVYPCTINDLAHAAPPDVAQLYDQAVSAQWNADTDIEWARIKPLPRPLQRALGQVFTFLAENELSALYVPSRFIARLHPHYVETAQFLATQMADEARHIDVFLKRARVGGGGVGISHATTSASLHSLLTLEDFTEAAFLLSVLGEGTFLDLLRYIEMHAPDEVTADIVRRARADETRHVHFGMSHVKHALSHDHTMYARLEAAVRKRSATLAGAGGVPYAVQDSLTILAAGGTDPAAVAKGHSAFRELMEVMHENRVKRLLNAGFSPAQAQTLSDLHTPNFM
ncbi:MAG: ferritin-like domain-containing protein [Planctomycetes bacterium]|nr:ferritin-like domain-containing protein [Planctomycetota bacterium]MCW8135388.1 ferritin-like domain-containing protein [Planctomycetota bacterium]